jgi:hypothetical protein
MYPRPAKLKYWVKDMRHSASIKDEEGYPAFALVNKVTGEAIKHSLGQSHPVRMRNTVFDLAPSVGPNKQGILVCFIHVKSLASQSV